MANFRGILYQQWDKALVENAARIVYTNIYLKINRAECFSLEDHNTAIRFALEEPKTALLRGRHYSRKHQFNKIERNTLLSLTALSDEWNLICRY
jgi:hypothetical protein